MKYISSKEKPLGYQLKSAAMTFVSAFFGILALTLVPYHQVILNLKPEDITGAAVFAGAMVLVRLVFIAAITALFELFYSKFKK